MSFRLSFLLLLLALSVPAGCESPLGPGDCEEGVIITVDQSGGTAFSWAPDCSVDILLVTALAGAGGGTATQVWQVTFDQAAVFPPVLYGSAPEGTKVLTEPVPLEAGRQYQVSLFRISGITLVSIGRQQFTAASPPS